MSKRKPTAGFAGRLSKALDRGPRPMSRRALGAALRDAYPNLRGTSDSGVRHYVDGEVRNPRTELLRAMADALGVRGDWLAFDQGSMTQAEQDVGAEPDQLTERRTAIAGALATGILGAEPEDLDDAFGGRVWSQLIGWWSSARPWRLNQADDSTSADERNERDLALAREVGAAAVAPLHALGLDPSQLSVADMETYLRMAEPVFAFASYLQTELSR